MRGNIIKIFAVEKIAPHEPRQQVSTSLIPIIQILSIAVHERHEKSAKNYQVKIYKLPAKS